ncbi:nucleotidyltransferase family protein [Bacillus sp. B15-48]|uniref:nucleotidyltransferase family protein n=1 Tax=Bacillus sp. B15-48 TaxID=1548601 RepID=UPI00193F8354|nr:nucleotidyltransferase family protein [Bacillus sp. B15-48]MBM4761218.1 NTP transferase domain-containing protein [Bacillus sp. B15-48]
MIKAGAVIIAAGLSSRMGDFKPMLPLGETTVIRKVIKTFQSAGVHKIVVVTGFNGNQLEKHIADMGVECFRNEIYAQSQMFDSAKIGFSAILDMCERVFFTPADIPLFGVDTIINMLNTRSDLICPTWQNKKGHPLLVSNELIKEFLEYTGDYGLHGAIKYCTGKMEYLEVNDWGIIYDMDTPQEYSAVKVMYEEMRV